MKPQNSDGDLTGLLNVQSLAVVQQRSFLNLELRPKAASPLGPQPWFTAATAIANIDRSSGAFGTAPGSTTTGCAPTGTFRNAAKTSTKPLSAAEEPWEEVAARAAERVAQLPQPSIRQRPPADSNCATVRR